MVSWHTVSNVLVAAIACAAGVEATTDNGNLQNASGNVSVVAEVTALAAADWGDEGCDRCQSLARGVVTLGSLAGCFAKCGQQEPGGGRILLCNVICNLLVKGGCSRYGLDCAGGVCHAAGRCSGPYTLLGSSANGTAENASWAAAEAEPMVMIAGVGAGAVDVTVNETEEGRPLAAAGPFWGAPQSGPETGGYDPTPEDGSDPYGDSSNCESCQGLANGVITVGAFAGCFAKCSHEAPGGGRVFMCNAICDVLALGGCSKYGLNCARGVCRAAGQCFGPGRRLSNAGVALSGGAAPSDVMV